jgi:YegS/Rv2252/BmrU family lipid kinase
MTEAKARAAMLVNTRSRSGRRSFESARARFEALDFAVDAHAVDEPAELPAAVERALGRGAELLILGGGDGTISSLVDLIVGREVRLGVLPLGTANSFARSLGIPLDIEGAVDVIVKGVPRRIDLGMIGDDYFANAAAIGLSPKIAETVPHLAKRWFGRAGYLGWAAIQFLRFRPFTLIVGEGAAAKRLRVVEVRISNGAFHGGTELVDSAELDSGRIVVQAVKGHVKRRLVRNWVASILRLEARHEDTVEFTGSALRIATEPALPISIDGEVLAKTPAVAKIAAGVIEVMAPAEA